MSKSLKKLIDINRLREFKNKLVEIGSAYVQTGAVDQTVAGTKTFSKPIVGSVTGSSGSCTGNAASANIATKADSATNATYANWLRASSPSDHLFHIEWDKAGYFWTYVTTSNGKYRAVRVARSDSSGNADTATKLAAERTINGTAFNGTANITTANWGTARNITITDGTNTSTAVSVNGSADVALTLPATIKANLTGNCSGSSGSCTGNAATATQFSANTTVALTGDATGTSAGSKKGWSVPVTLANSGVTAGTYGPSADVTGNNNATISVPQITVDAKGRVTSVTNRTLTCKNNTYNVYNKTLTIQKNGTNVATFTSNSNTDVTANITVPTKTSELTNDSGYLTSHQSLSNYVTLNGAQTISGNKTFTGTLTGTLTGNCSGTSGGLLTNTTFADRSFTYTEGQVAIGTTAGKAFKGSSNNAALVSFPENGTAFNDTSANIQNLRLTWHSDGKYLHDLFTSPNSIYFWHRDVHNASARPWRRIVEENTTDVTPPTWNISIGGNAATATKATGNANGKELTNTIIKGLSISGKTITYTQIDGSTGTLTTQDTNTDTLMTQNVSTTNATYPILLCPTANATANQGAKTSIFASGVKVNPSTNVITASGFSGPLTGNVTGNCSGSSGSCTGNAATATKLATARTINGTAFNGTANITTANWGTARNISITDGTNTSTAVSVNGSANVSLNLPATIKANLTGNCSGSSGSCTGNAATATKLAAKRTIALSGAATGTATGFDGSGNITIPVTALSSSAIRAQWYAAFPDGAEAHNAMWGGRDITAAFNNGTVSANIANGTFRGIFPGDYITKSVTISGKTYTVNWVIADCDYWINKGDTATTAMTAHHVVIVPQAPIFDTNMNATNTTEGGYADSRMYTETIPACATGIVNAFGSSHILTFRDAITNSVDTSHVSSGIPQRTGTPGWWGVWVSAQCNLMSEKMVYGAPVCSAGAMDNSVATRQMSAFRLSERLINYNKSDWWLRDVVSSAVFAVVYGGGGANAGVASSMFGVRPFALLK